MSYKQFARFIEKSKEVESICICKSKFEIICNYWSPHVVVLNTIAIRRIRFETMSIL